MLKVGVLVVLARSYRSLEPGKGLLDEEAVGLRLSDSETSWANTGACWAIL